MCLCVGVCPRQLSWNTSGPRLNLKISGGAGLRVDTKDTHGLAIPREFQGRKLLDARGPIPPRNSNSARDMRLKYVEIGLLMFASC